MGKTGVPGVKPLQGVKFVSPYGREGSLNCALTVISCLSSSFPLHKCAPGKNTRSPFQATSLVKVGSQQSNLYSVKLTSPILVTLKCFFLSTFQDQFEKKIMYLHLSFPNFESNDFALPISNCLKLICGQTCHRIYWQGFSWHVH